MELNITPVVEDAQLSEVLQRLGKYCRALSQQRFLFIVNDNLVLGKVTFRDMALNDYLAAIFAYVFPYTSRRNIANFFRAPFYLVSFLGNKCQVCDAYILVRRVSRLFYDIFEYPDTGQTGKWKYLFF